jgi:hypothetical protein
MCPPWRSTIAFTIDKPSPLPLDGVSTALEASAL